MLARTLRTRLNPFLRMQARAFSKESDFDGHSDFEAKSKVSSEDGLNAQIQ